MPYKLLLADDSVTIQRVIELTFADEDVQVIAVGNGQDAIDRVQRDHPDIVLADVGMPQRNGYEVAAFIKGQPALAHIPVVLLTGAFEPVDEERARAAGCDGVLVKPFEPQMVISRVKDLLAGRKPLGMWGSAPIAQGPVRPAAQATQEPRGAASPSGDSLDAYFDELDAAFASAGPPAPADAAAPPQAAPRREPTPISRRPEPAATPQAAPRQSSSDALADWDPDLRGDPGRPAVIESPLAVAPKPIAPSPAAPETPPPPQPAAVAPPLPPAPAPPPSLVDAFTALLAAEQRIELTPSAAAVPPPGAAPAPPAAPTEEFIEEVCSRVLSRLTDQTRPTILDVAERLVREEIERIKQSGN
ncbi:MAG TPA: response regulator [Vicinamibacterales bacterium]|nr:response regulator [Vicinamibacterales bacterium]